MVYLYLSIESLKILFIHSAFNAKPVKIVHASTSSLVYLNWMIQQEGLMIFAIFRLFLTSL